MIAASASVSRAAARTQVVTTAIFKKAPAKPVRDLIPRARYGLYRPRSLRSTASLVFHCLNTHDHVHRGPMFGRTTRDAGCQ